MPFDHVGDELDLLVHQVRTVGDPPRHVRVGPRRLGALRRPARVTGGHLTEENERLFRQAGSAEVRGVVGEPVHVDAEMNGPGVCCVPCVPRHPSGQRPVDLDGRRVPLEVRQVVDHPGRKMLGTDQVLEEIRCRHVGDDGAPGRDALAGGEGDALGDAVLQAHPVDRGVHPDLTAASTQPGDERVDDAPRSADRHRIAVGVPDHRQQPAVHGAARPVRRQIGVQRVAGEKHRAARTVEVLLPEPAHRHDREPRQPEGLAEAEQSQQPLRREAPAGTAGKAPPARSSRCVSTARPVRGRTPRPPQRTSRAMRRCAPLRARARRSGHPGRRAPGRPERASTRGRIRRDSVRTGSATPPRTGRRRCTGPTGSPGRRPPRSGPHLRSRPWLRRPVPTSRRRPAGSPRRGRCGRRRSPQRQVPNRSQKPALPRQPASCGYCPADPPFQPRVAARVLLLFLTR